VAPLVFEPVRPKSVIDVGCGRGEWLSIFKELGAEDIRGVEHPGFEHSSLSVPSETIIEHDLREHFATDLRYDLTVSLEVAEHLPPERAEGFVEDLCLLAPVVLFSAAVPAQSDPKRSGHVNERWQSYWASLFAGYGYEVVDCVRPAVWENSELDFWYAQNTVLYASFDRLASNGALARAQKDNAVFPLSVAHPALAEKRVHPRVAKREHNKLKRRIERLEAKLEAERSKGLLRRIFKDPTS
jgi:hypothetical protein